MFQRDAAECDEEDNGDAADEDADEDDQV